VEGARGPARRLYIDEETGLTLGVDAYNHLLQPVLHSRLSKLDVSPKIGDGTFERPQAIRAAARQVAWGTEELGRTEEQFQKVAQKSGILPPRPAYTPDGFVLDGYALQRCHKSQGQVTTVSTRYTDGLNTLTVFALRRPADDSGQPMTCDFGPGNLASRRDGLGCLVALGDLPTPVLNRVLESSHFELAAANGTEPAR
jgi:negative regulator of sigma E activity